MADALLFRQSPIYKHIYPTLSFTMKYSRILPTLFAAALALPCFMAGCNSDSKKLADKERELEELRQLAELDKKEMENQYAEFASQYGELKKNVQNDSLVAKLEAEQARAERLLKELKNLKSSSSAEILRLKKELATVRAVLRDYIHQVDSLQRLNQELRGERDQALADAQRTREENVNIHAQNSALNEKVAIAAQLNATGITISVLKSNGKAAKKSKDIKRFAVNFTIARNVTAQAGQRTVYVRLLKPNQQIAAESGTFAYENRHIGYSACRAVEYNGQDTHLTIYVPISEFLSAGTYTAHIFADGQMIGQGSVHMAK